MLKGGVEATIGTKSFRKRGLTEQGLTHRACFPSSSQTGFVPLGDPAGVCSHCAPAGATLRSRLRRGAPRVARTRQRRQAGAPLTLSAREAGSCCGGSAGSASLPLPPGHRRGRRSASGGVPVGPGPAPLHLVPDSARRNPVSCIDPEAAFTAQQQHVTRRTCHVRCVNGRGHQRSESSPTNLGLPWR